MTLMFWLYFFLPYQIWGLGVLASKLANYMTTASFEFKCSKNVLEFDIFISK